MEQKGKAVHWAEPLLQVSAFILTLQQEKVLQEVPLAVQAAKMAAIEFVTVL